MDDTPEASEEKPRFSLRKTLEKPAIRWPVLIVILAINLVVWPYVYQGYTRDYRAVQGATWDGFDLSNATIPRNKILQGGPPKDGIPALHDPKFITPDQVDFLQDDDEVLAFISGDQAVAYPLKILIWHELVNDTVNGIPILASYCPLCGTCMIFDRRINGQEHSFGVSSLLYNSDVLMYDQQTDSLWSQLKQESVAGPLVNTRLTWLPSRQMRWAAWKEQYPQSRVLSTDTGHNRNYSKQAYQKYLSSDEFMFPVDFKRTELPKKSWVLGVLYDGVPIAIPEEQLRTHADTPTPYTIGDKTLTITYTNANRDTIITDARGEFIPAVWVFWFAWQAFYPDTQLTQPAVSPQTEQ